MFKTAATSLSATHASGQHIACAACRSDRWEDLLLPPAWQWSDSARVRRLQRTERLLRNRHMLGRRKPSHRPDDYRRSQLDHYA